MRLMVLATLIGLLALDGAPVSAQNAGTYQWVHRQTIPMRQHPFTCYCYTVSAAPVIWERDVMERADSFSRAMEVRNRLSARRDTCTYCKASRTENSTHQRIAVFRNCRKSPCTIGVAIGSYAQPGNRRYVEGWRSMGAEYQSHADAWRAACAAHRTPQYHSPDIQRGRVNCAEFTSSSKSTLTGVWTCSGRGTMTVEQINGNVKGHYSWNGGGTVVGKINNNRVFSAVWTESGRKGSFTMTLSKDGKSISGRWAYISGGSGGGQWGCHRP